jgi:hypothetical protein
MDEIKVPCYVCAKPTRDYGDHCYNCCRNCSDKICNIAGRNNFAGSTGCGFKKDIEDTYGWYEAICHVINKSKKYQDECPCGIHPSDCSYHK